MIHELATTTHGRLLSLAITIALVGGGVSGLMHDPMGVALMCVSLLGAVVVALIAIALSISTRAAFAAMAAVVLPLLFFLYAVGLQVAIHSHATWGAYGFIALGALFGANALRGGKAPVEGAAPPKTADAH